MSPSQRRRALNEAVFPEVNESIAKLQHDFAATEHLPLNLVCECDQLECTEQISVSAETYDQVRSDSGLFLVLSGHEDDSIEAVIDEHDNYLVVRKHSGEPQEIAKQTDPRA